MVTLKGAEVSAKIKEEVQEILGTLSGEAPKLAIIRALLLCIPYIARFGSIAAYVRTWPVRTYAGKRAGSCI